MSLLRIMSFGQGKVTTSRRVLAYQSMASALVRLRSHLQVESLAERETSTAGLAENTPLRT